MPPKKSKIQKKTNYVSDDSDIDEQSIYDEYVITTGGKNQEPDENEFNEREDDVDVDIDGDVDIESEDEDLEINAFKDDDDGELNKDEDDCLYRFSGKNKVLINDDDYEEEDEEYDDDDIIDEIHKENQSSMYVLPKDRITRPVLTTYERVRILATRARQLTLGAKPMLKGVTNFDAKYIATQELEKRVIPFNLIRCLPSGKKEKWFLSEL
jgi:DNA-directed RNA polymerase subunit K/omega